MNKAEIVNDIHDGKCVCWHNKFTTEMELAAWKVKVKALLRYSNCSYICERHVYIQCQVACRTTLVQENHMDFSPNRSTILQHKPIICLKALSRLLHLREAAGRS